MIIPLNSPISKAVTLLLIHQCLVSQYIIRNQWFLK